MQTFQIDEEEDEVEKYKNKPDKEKISYLEKVK